MNRDAPLAIDGVAPRRWGAVTPAIELLVLGGAVAIGLASYLVLTRSHDSGLFPPPLIALLLVANLLPGVIVLMLIGRRIARRRAARSPVGGRGQLHVRLVAIFSVLSAVPMLLVTVVASLLFQYGVQFWYSGQARTAFENAIVLTRQSYNLILDRYERDTYAMAGDLGQFISDAQDKNTNAFKVAESRRFVEYYYTQVLVRNLSESALFVLRGNGEFEILATVNPYDANLPNLIAPALRDALGRIRQGRRSAVLVTGERIKVLTPVPGSDQLFVYAARVTGHRTMDSEFRLATEASNSYHKLISRARALQLRFNAALLAISLLIVGIAVWIALAIADRLVRPVGELVAAAQRVSEGDLTARVPDHRRPDEVGTLATAFNRMTAQLERQNADLTSANATLENRRALIEAVMAGVSAGVVATAEDGTIRLANASAARLLGAPEGGPVGQPLAAVAPELAALVDDDLREAVVQVTPGEGLSERTLAVRMVRTGAGPILTFDDITQQILDQRRAAWSDVARRIAHEIKNPLTPIQLAAERLQRRYGATVEAGDTTFARLTETIVRQVGDLRRMVDEFSSFARMPKPVFRDEPVLDTARQALFLHEVAHPGIRFELIHAEPGPTLRCDRRQLGQALTNIVKNAVEAIEAKGDAADTDASVVMTLAEEPGRVTIEVADTGIGLPADRERIVEPYVTTRARGTGLGLAIVKKIVEEHFGTISFADRPGGGTVVCMVFDTQGAERGRGLDGEEGGPSPEPAGEGRLAIATPSRT